MTSQHKIEFGDFQTPPELAKQVCELLNRRGLSVASVIEPTCGKGSFVIASEQAFPHCGSIVGYEVNPDYVAIAQSITCKAKIRQENFFHKDWHETLEKLAEPILVVGNPPWVTNSAVGTISGTNLPRKSNLQRLSGFDAITGKSNFDISEWMLVHLLERLSGRTAVLAMLCKTVVARKVLQRAWQTRMRVAESTLYGIDAKAHFGAAVDACLLVCVLEPKAESTECRVFDSLDAFAPRSTIAFRANRLIADLDAHTTHGHLFGKSAVKWRSGIKHDCARVMELRLANGEDIYTNGLGQRVRLENDFLFPMLKSSDLARHAGPSRYMLVTQRSIGEKTCIIEKQAPLTWRYLESHKRILDSRSSSIYRNRPRFSIFGVGDYSFAPWKVSISGFYKKFDFIIVGPKDGKPVVLDDTCYFLPCETEEEARQLANLLNAQEAQGFFNAFVFWDAKRPITVNLLACLDLDALAAECGSKWASKQATLPLFGESAYNSGDH